jgi:ADP-ribosylglycohydrolase
VLTCSEASADSLRNAAFKVHHREGRSAGNGSLMRTAPVALTHLYDEAALIAAAAAVSTLTHYEADATEACVLWCLAIRHAVLTGELDLRAGLHYVDPVWTGRIDEAEREEPAHFARNNGWVVSALQGAWSAIVRSDSLEDGLRRAVCGGGDTDTVAAIAGALLGARYGENAVPAQWRAALHGWPGWRAGDLTDAAHQLVTPPLELGDKFVTPADGFVWFTAEEWDAIQPPSNEETP